MELLQSLIAATARLKSFQYEGVITRITNGALEVEGLSRVACMGDEVKIGDDGTWGEIVQISPDTTTIVPFDRPKGLNLGASVVLHGAPVLAPSPSWVGRTIDPFGRPLDGTPLLPGSMDLPVHNAALPARKRRGLGPRLQTGLGVLDTMLPLAQGQRVGLFAGSGVGKSTLIGNLARNVPSDVCVLALIGERGRELNEFLHSVLGEEGRARCVIVAATSDQAPAVRLRAAFSAMTIAEYFRDQGAQVLFMADSITRFAEAYREVAVSAGEPASMRGFPASMTHALASLCERAGPGTGTLGDITAVLSVLVSGSDMEEPVADILRGLLDGHIVMDREIAERGRYPAIDVLRSVSRCLPEAAEPSQNATISKVRRLLSTYDQSALMVQSGLYTPGNDSLTDHAIRAFPKIDEFFGNAEQRTIEENFRILEAACH